jgi:hypothetical protein
MKLFNSAATTVGVPSIGISTLIRALALILGVASASFLLMLGLLKVMIVRNLRTLTEMH